jgi:hypothetical protein
LKDLFAATQLFKFNDVAATAANTPKEVSVEHVSKYHFIIFVILMIICHGASHGQDINREAKYKDGDSSFLKFLGRELISQWKSSKDKSCVEGYIYVQFSINEVGNVVDIKFYELPNTPKLIPQIMTEALLVTNGKWQTRLVDGKPVKSSTFLIPFIFGLESGCGGSVHQLAEVRPVGLVKFLTDMKHAEDIIILKPVKIFSAN